MSAIMAFVRGGIAEFKSLSSAPRELWVIYILKMLESYAYFSQSLILPLYLNSFGISDIDAGWMIGTYGVLISVFGFGVGMLVDNLGVRKSLMIGSMISFVARLIISLTSSKAILTGTLFSLMPLGMAMGIPVMSTGIRRHTTLENRGFAFAIFYSVMNIAALTSGALVDVFRNAITQSVAVAAAA